MPDTGIAGGYAGGDGLAPLEPFDQTVTLLGGAAPEGWQGTLRDTRGVERFRVWLRSLVAVEGGTVAFEVGLSYPSNFGANELGERSSFDEVCKCYPERPSVVDVRHVAQGIDASQFGRVRRFPIPQAQQELVFEVLSLSFGHGVGMCDSCERIERIEARIRVEESRGRPTRS
jgi:hypothetical protein